MIGAVTSAGLGNPRSATVQCQTEKFTKSARLLRAVTAIARALYGIYVRRQ